MGHGHRTRDKKISLAVTGPLASGIDRFSAGVLDSGFAFVIYLFNWKRKKNLRDVRHSDTKKPVPDPSQTPALPQQILVPRLLVAFALYELASYRARRERRIVNVNVVISGIIPDLFNLVGVNCQAAA